MSGTVRVMVNASDPPQRRRLSGRRSAPRADRADLRETILDALAQLLERGSFAELTVADILAAAAVSRGSYYFYFDSKHDVLASWSGARSPRATMRRNPGWPARRT